MKFRDFRNHSILIIFSIIFLFSINSKIIIQTQSVNETIQINNPSEPTRISNLSINSLKTQTDYKPWVIFKYFWNKTFFCILFLFFQVNGFLLFFTSVSIQMILTYLTEFWNLNLFQHVPIQIFETVAVLFYYGFSFGIIYTLMFGDTNVWSKDSIKRKPREFYDYYEANKFSYYFSKFYEFKTSFLDEFLKIFGLIFISFLIQNDEYDNIFISSSDYNMQGNNFFNFGTQCFLIFISSLVSIILATLINYKFHVNCSLWLGSLLFLLMGTEICVKMLSRT